MPINVNVMGAFSNSWSGENVKLIVIQSQMWWKQWHPTNAHIADELQIFTLSASLVYASLQFSSSEKSWPTANSTQNLIILLPTTPLATQWLFVVYVQSYAHSKQHKYLTSSLVYHLSSNVITATQWHFKSNWAFLWKRQKTGVSREKNILTLS